MFISFWLYVSGSVIGLALVVARVLSLYDTVDSTGRLTASVILLVPHAETNKAMAIRTMLATNLFITFIVV